VVKVADNGDGTLAITYDGKNEFAGVPFANKFFEQVAKIQFNKWYVGENATEGVFSFVIEPTDENFKPNENLTPQPAGEVNEHNDAVVYTMKNGKFEGDVSQMTLPVTYHEPGTYHYLVTEVVADDSAIVFDESQIGVTVTIPADGKDADVRYTLFFDGQQVGEQTADAQTFYNNGEVSMRYRSAAMRKFNGSAQVAVFQPEIKKVLENGIIEADQFSFALYTGTNTAAAAMDSATNDEFGTVSFKAIEYVEPGTYTYTITEDKGADPTIVYSDQKIALTVEVKEVKVNEGTDAETTILEATGTYSWTDKDGKAQTYVVKTGEEPVGAEVPTITNSFDTIRVHAKKYTRGTDQIVAGATYGLWMVNPEGEDVLLGNQVSDANGDLYYNIPTVEGVAYYFLEAGPAPAGHLIDPYPTDYFTLEIGSSREDAVNGFALVYESDFGSRSEFMSYVQSNS